MKIIGSFTSPYTRIVRVICEELNIAYEHEVTGPFGKTTPEQQALIGKHNPLMRVPIMIEDDTVLFESRVIANYLYNKHHYRALSTDEENIISTIYGALDTGIIRFLLLKNDPQLDVSRGYFTRFAERLDRSMQWLDGELTGLQKKSSAPTETFGLWQIVLICCLEWFDKRQIYDWRKFPQLVQLHARYRERPSLLKTRIPENT